MEDKYNIWIYQACRHNHAVAINNWTAIHTWYCMAS